MKRVKSVVNKNLKYNSATCLYIVVMFLVSLLMFTGCSQSGDEPQTQSDTQSTEAVSDKDKTADSETGVVESLAGTKWRLLEFQSMDDSVDTIRPEDSSKFTMQLNADGAVNMMLDCNQANGTWSSQAGPDGTSGRFEFGKLATTNALCPAPRLDEQISTHTQYVRSYLLKDGKLYLSLMADGGIYVWEPHDDQRNLQTEPDSVIEAAIIRESPDYNQEMMDIGNGITARYVYTRVDLNGDGAQEVFVYLLGSIFCGTGGCSLMLFTPSQEGYELVDNFPISRLPVIVSDERTSGWNNIVRLESGGGAPRTYVTHVYDGRHYVEKERVPGDKAPPGKKYLDGDISYDNGIPLKPNNGG